MLCHSTRCNAFLCGNMLICGMQGLRKNLKERFFFMSTCHFALMNWPIPLFVIGLSDHFRDAPTQLDDGGVYMR